MVIFLISNKIILKTLDNKKHIIQDNARMIMILLQMLGVISKILINLNSNIQDHSLEHLGEEDFLWVISHLKELNKYLINFSKICIFIK
jgi:hypothetical protein